MSIYLFFIKKFLKKKSKFILDFENILSVVGIFIGVFAILIVSSVMNGFDKDITKRILSSKPEIMVHKKGFIPISDYKKVINKIEKNRYVKSVIPICESELIAIKADNFTPIKCLGVGNKFPDALNHIVIGSLKNFDEKSVILSMDLSLDLRATVGENIILSDIKGSVPSPFGLLPNKKTMKVAAIYRTGLPEVDKNTIFTKLNFLMEFSHIKGISYLQIKTKNRTVATRKELSKMLGSEFVVEDWTQLNSNIFNAVKLEKAVMMLVLMLMIIIAVFNMSGFLLKLIENKQNEIGILKTIGINEKQLQNIFRLYALFQGVIGALSGLVFSLLILMLQDKYHFVKIPVPGLPLRYIPVEINTIEFFIVPLCAIIISYLSILFPINKIKKINIIEILRKNG